MLSIIKHHLPQLIHFEKIAQVYIYIYIYGTSCTKQFAIKSSEEQRKERLAVVKYQCMERVDKVSTVGENSRREKKRTIQGI